VEAGTDPLQITRKGWLPYGNFRISNPNAFKTNLSWNDFDFIRHASGLPVLVKGVTTPADAVAAVKAGGRGGAGFQPWRACA